MKTHLMRMRQVASILILALVVSCNSLPKSNLSPLSTLQASSSSSASIRTDPEQGGQLAFVSDRRQRGDMDIWLFELSTKQMKPVTSDDWQDVQPAWSPDGRTLAFISFKGAQLSSLRAFSLSDQSVHTLVPPEQYVSITDFVWSGDGKSIFYTALDGQTFEERIWRLDLQTGERQNVVSGDRPIAVSADGQYLAYSARRSEPPNALVLRVLRLSDETEIKIAKDHFDPFGEDWSPTENALAVAYGTGFSQIAVYTVNGEEINQQSEDSLLPKPKTALCDLKWAPDGEKILVVRMSVVANVCQGELLVYDASLKHYQALSVEGLVGYPTWSKDGQLIAYSKDDTLNVMQYRSNVLKEASGEIWIAESTGFNASPLITSTAYSGQPTWQP